MMQRWFHMTLQHIMNSYPVALANLHVVMRCTTCVCRWAIAQTIQTTRLSGALKFQAQSWAWNTTRINLKPCHRHRQKYSTHNRNPANRVLSLGGVPSFFLVKYLMLVISLYILDKFNSMKRLWSAVLTNKMYLYSNAKITISNISFYFLAKKNSAFLSRLVFHHPSVWLALPKWPHQITSITIKAVTPGNAFCLLTEYNLIQKTIFT